MNKKLKTEMGKTFLSIIVLFGITLTARAQDETVNGNLKITGNIDATGTNKRIHLGGVGKSTFGISFSKQYPNYGIFYTEGSPDYVSISPNGNANNGILNVYGDGKIGIKTDNPSSDADLHIKDSRASFFIENTNSSNWAFMRLKGSGVNFWDIAQYGNNDYLEFRPKGSSPTFVLKQNGGIGIKTIPSTDSDLHIKDSRASFFIENTNSNNWAFMRLKGSGTNFWDIAQYGNNDYLEFRPKGSSPTAVFKQNGNVAIYGKLESKEVKVTLTPTADFVFEENYNLPALDFIEKHIKTKKHLPEIASAREMEKNGVNIGEFQIQLLQKIEELTLYTIQQQKDIKEQNSKLKKQQKEIKELKLLNKKLLELQSRLEKLESKK